jgi:hypothetical protein
LGEDIMDNYFKELRETPPLEMLDGLDDRVMDALAMRRREVGMTRNLMLLSAVLSLGGGALVGISTNHRDAQASPLSPLVSTTALAPSSLLDAR